MTNILREEDLRPACIGLEHVYDATIDQNAGPGYRAALELARSICSECPVTSKCLRENWDNEGVIAGTTWLERKGRPGPTNRPSCGTANGANLHYKRREKPCEPCRVAGNARRNEIRQARKQEQRGAA